MRWIKASEEFPDNADHWLATDKYQEGKSVHCKYMGLLGVGYTWREKGVFGFNFYPIKMVTPESNSLPEYKDVNEMVLSYKDMHNIEWLDETESPSDSEAVELVSVKFYNHPDEYVMIRKNRKHYSVKGVQYPHDEIESVNPYKP